MLSKSDKSKVKAFLKGKMSGTNLTAFEQRLEEELPLLRAVFMEKMIKEAAENMNAIQQSSQGLANAQKMAANLGDDLFTDMEKTQLWEIRQQGAEEKYTYFELLEMFGKVEEYEENLVLRTDSSNRGIEVKKPSNGIEIAQTLDFELPKAIPFPLSCTLQNNQEETISETQIIANQSQFTVDLPNLKPGRYYWILKVNSNDRQARQQYKTVIRMFLVKGWLNPY